MPLRNAPSALPTTLRFMGTRLLHRVFGGNDGARLSPLAWRTRIEAAVADPAIGIASCGWLEVPATSSGWIESGIVLAQGEAVTVLAAGRLHISKLFDVGVGPVVGLWYRVGEGEVTKLAGGDGTLIATEAGPLRFVTKPPGEFGDRKGAFDSTQTRDGVSGAFTVALIRWRETPAEALAAASRKDVAVFGAAHSRLEKPIKPPQGWRYLWRLGPGEIFSNAPCRDDLGHDLCCHTSADVGILQFPVDVSLTPDTRLDWSWCVSQLPSKLAEHIQATHDYLSIAVEFDNGLDLTYMWSAALPVGTVFQCPLPWWDQRETHWVVRSGTDELGRWLTESRAVRADYETAIGVNFPSRIVAVWLIANTAFQRGVGECRYRGITVRNGDTRAVVYR